MTENENSGWEDDLTAELYDKFAQEFPMYRQTSRDLVKLVGLQKGMTIVDLACGVGTTTQEILYHIGNTGKVYAVDLSAAMLTQAKKHITAANVDFVQSPAEELDQVIKPEVDVVVSNSAVWQLDLEETFKAVGKVLKPGGKFAFNIPGQFFRFTKPDPRARIISLPVWMYAFASSRYGLKDTGYRQQQVLNAQMIEEAAQKAQLSLVTSKELTYDRTDLEVYEFERIPVMTKKLLPGLDYKTRMDILDLAYAKLDKTIKYPSRWMFFILQK